jgi:septum formation protein
MSGSKFKKAIILPHPLILASASPRRRVLLSEAGFTFDVLAPNISEPTLPQNQSVNGKVWAETLAYFKARTISLNHPEAIVIGADTLVLHGKQIIGKPADQEDARRILTTMFGGKNQVITGLAILKSKTHQKIITHVSTTLTMREMKCEELEAYLAGGAWQDKAGAYALQEGGDKFLESMDGSYSNVVGLPMEKLNELLRTHFSGSSQ